MKDIVVGVRETIRRNSFLNGGEKVLVAVSGGADSVSLIYLLNKLSTDLNISLAIAHLNHSIRGEEGDRDETFVKELGSKLGLETFTEKIDVPKYQHEHRLSLEAAAREVRYDFLNRTAKEIGADRIATGHTADDQAETVLMRFLRGSGLGGLSGIPAGRGNIIRPLIDIKRSQIVEFLNNEKIDFINDSSNMDLSMTRNRIRYDLIPKLAQDYNPNILETLNAISSISREEDAYLDDIVSKELKKATNDEGEGFLLLNLSSLSPLHLAIKRRLIRRGIERIKGNLQGIDYSHIESILDLIEPAASPKRIDLPGDIAVYIRYGKIGIYKREAIPTYQDFDIKVAIPGETIIHELGLKVSTDIINSDCAEQITGNERDLEQIFDIGLKENGLTVRNRRNGDRFSPKGVAGSKKVKDYLIDKKVCREERDRIPIFVSEKDIIWIGGYRRSSVGLVEDIKKGGILIRISPL